MSIKVANAVWEAAPFAQTDLLILLALADHADDQGRCYPSIPRIAKRARCSERYAREVIARLEQSPWLVCERIPGKATRYTVQTPTPEPGFTPEPQTRGEQEIRPPLNPSSATPEPQLRRTSSNHQRTSAAGAPKRSATTAEILAEHGITNDKDRDDFLRSLNARIPGALVASLVKSGLLEERVTDWRRGRRTSGTSPWDRRPNVTDLRLAREAAEREAAASGTPTVPYQQWWDR